EAVDDASSPGGESMLGLAELLLKDAPRVDRMARDDARLAELIPRFLTLAIVTFSIYSVAMAAVLHFLPAAALPPALEEHWSSGAGPTFALWGAYTIGMIAASGVCLPSFYFFGLLAGVRLTFAQTVAHIV